MFWKMGQVLETTRALVLYGKVATESESAMSRYSKYMFIPGTEVVFLYNLSPTIVVTHKEFFEDLIKNHDPHKISSKKMFYILEGKLSYVGVKDLKTPGLKKEGFKYLL